METLETVLKEYLRWAVPKFKDETIKANINHLKEEVNELSEAIFFGDREETENELADVLMLAHYTCHVLGYKPENVLRKKFEEIKTRTWLPADETGRMRSIDAQGKKRGYNGASNH